MVHKLKLICLLLLVAGCAPMNARPSVHHVVLVWLKADTAPEVRERIIEGSGDLKAIPGIRELQVGKAIPSERPIVDDSFSFGIMMRFDSVADMNAYLTDPKHVEFVDKQVRPYLEKLVVYDF
jgi:antibiotic biosynthesis monooxygenase (ABM) superfamily enzyme